MNKIIKYLILSLMVFTLVGCAESSVNKDESDSQFIEYGVAGNITEISKNEETGSFRILVKGEEDNGATYTQAWVSVNDETKIYGNEAVSMDDLKLEMYVNVFFEGPVAESFPVQASAKQINIIEEDKEIETNTDDE